jgi:hypothetical protein
MIVHSPQYVCIDVSVAATPADPRPATTTSSCSFSRPARGRRAGSAARPAPGLSERQRSETATTVHRILRKIPHGPTVRAKEFSTGPNGPACLDALRQPC